MNPHYGRLYKYILSAHALMESIKVDLARDGSLSAESIVALSKANKDRAEVDKLLDLIKTLNSDTESIIN